VKKAGGEKEEASKTKKKGEFLPKEHPRAWRREKKGGGTSSNRQKKKGERAGGKKVQSTGREGVLLTRKKRIERGNL